MSTLVRVGGTLVLEVGEMDLLAVVAEAQANRWFVGGSTTGRLRAAALHALADALALLITDTDPPAYTLASATAEQARALARSALKSPP